MTDVITRIRLFNDNREVERLRMKYHRMAKDAFTFFRGTCHLFYEDWPQRTPLNAAPPAWICGDLHFENFGSYKGDNRLVYFDLNDFDEAVLAPCTWDITRFLTSLIVGARYYQLPQRTAQQLGQAFLEAYRLALRAGKPRWVERATADGMVGDLLQTLAKRTQRALLKKWTRQTKSGRKIELHHKRALKASADEHKRVRRILAELVRADGLGPLRMLDAVRRVAGTGSLGLERYVVLAEGPRLPGGIGLLDIKVARRSSLEPYSLTPQPPWKSSAMRIATVQRRLQAIAPAFLAALPFKGTSYVIRELQPTEDQLALKQSKGKRGRLEPIAVTMGQTVAWAHLRGSAHQGAAGPEDLMRFAASVRWEAGAFRYAASYADRVQRDWAAFAAWWDKAQRSDELERP